MTYLPTRFRPQFQKHAGEVCAGVEIVVSDQARFPSFRAGVELLRCFCEIGRDRFDWRSEVYEFVDDRPAIDLLAGTEALRLALDEGCPLDAWVSSWDADERDFERQREALLLYR